MSHRQPVRVADIAQYTCIIDARTPAEFELDRIPGAINCPVLSNEERVTIGTIYKQVSPFEAKRLGAAMVAANLAKHLHTTFADKPAQRLHGDVVALGGLGCAATGWWL